MVAGERYGSPESADGAQHERTYIIMQRLVRGVAALTLLAGLAAGPVSAADEPQRAASMSPAPEFGGCHAVRIRVLGSFLGEIGFYDHYMQAKGLVAQAWQEHAAGHDAACETALETLTAILRNAQGIEF